MNTVVYFTKKGLEEKKQEYETLLQERPDAVRELSKAREMGDLSENGYYKGARFKLSDIDRRLRQLKHLLKVSKVKEYVSNGVVDIGSKVVISNGQTEQTFEIVGTYEANPKEGKISSYSPLGKILIGKKEGEQAELRAGETTTIFTIISLV